MYSSYYPLGIFGGRQPLCGTGVTSLIAVTSSPAVASALIAASLPGPGPLTSTFQGYSSSLWVSVRTPTR